MTERTPCPAAMVSSVDLRHVHSCTGGHKPGEDHLCPMPCGRRWGQA